MCAAPLAIAPLPRDHIARSPLGDGHVSAMSRVPISSLLTSDEGAIQRFSENGREYYRYRNDMYLFPCDDTEAERLDIMHTLIYTTALKSRLHLAKLSDPRRVLDIGFGTGFWMMEMAKKYPRAEVIGYDLILPDGKLPKVGHTLHWQAPVDYLAPRWPVEDGSVDIVHMAQLCGSVNDWASLYRKAYRSLRATTGQIEHIEIDWTPRAASGQPMPAEASVMWQWWEWMKHASRMAGRSIVYRDDTEELLEQAGFVDIHHKKVKIPLCLHGRKDPQEYALAHNYQSAMAYVGSESYKAFCMALFTRWLQWPPAQAKIMCDQVLAVAHSKDLPLHHELHVWTARKPLT